MADNKITKAQAQALRAAFIASHTADTPRGFLFAKDTVLAILDQAGATGLRVHFGDDGAGKILTYLVGTDNHGNDMRSGEIYTTDKECPPHCGDGD